MCDPMTLVRWFGLNEYEHLIVPDLVELGLEIVTTGDAPTDVALVINHDLAPAAWRYCRRHGVPLIAYVWDVPPFRLGPGSADHVFSLGGRLVTVPRLGRRYTTRRGYYSRLRYVATHATAVWTPSTASARDISGRFGVAARATPYCYDSRVFTSALGSRRAPTPDSAEVTLVSVSRLTPPKNQAAVVRAAAHLRARSSWSVAVLLSQSSKLSPPDSAFRVVCAVASRPRI